MRGAKQLRQEKKKHRAADKEEKKMENNMKELNLNEREKAAGGVDDGPGHKDNKGGLIDLIVDLFKKLF